MTRRYIVMGVTCCDLCHTTHRTRLAARLHHWWLTHHLWEWDEWRGDLRGNVTMLTKHMVSWRGRRVDLHKMVGTDAPYCFHSHPARALRVVFWGGYWEERMSGDTTTMERVGAPSWSWVEPQCVHRISSLINGRCSYSLWIRGRKTAEVQLVGEGWLTQ